MLNNKNIIAAFILALVFFGCFAFIAPEYNNIVLAREMFQERNTRYTERSELLKKVSDLNTQYNDNIDSINKLDTLLPTSKHQDEMVSSMQDLAGQTGLVLAELGVADLTNLTDIPYKSSLITVRAVGQYEQLFNFLKLMEQNLRLYDVQSLGISESTASVGTGKSLNFEIKILANSIK